MNTGFFRVNYPTVAGQLLEGSTAIICCRGTYFEVTKCGSTFSIVEILL